MGVAKVANDEEFAVFVAQLLAYLSPSELCNLTQAKSFVLFKSRARAVGLSSWLLKKS